MKRAIRTLVALLAFSSTAVAEDWEGAPTLPQSVIMDIEVLCVGPQSIYLMNPTDQRCRIGELPYNSGIQYYSYFSTTDLFIQAVTGNGFGAGSSLPGGVSSSVSSVGIMMSGVIADPSSVTGYKYVFAHVPLAEFARSSTVGSIGGNVAALEQRVIALETLPQQILDWNAQMQDARRQADEGSAMAAAMTTVAPADGKANRIGFNTATYNGSTAVAVSYSRAAGDVDFNVGVAMAGDNAMVKAGAGFSW